MSPESSAQKKIADINPKTVIMFATAHEEYMPEAFGVYVFDYLIQREDRSTVIYTSQDRFTTSEGLSELEEKLDKNLFFRCHKSYIINLSAVSKIYPYGRWTYIVKHKGTEKDALLTHDKYEELEKLFA